jgi:ABC-type transport system substrate-binding protein
MLLFAILALLAAPHAKASPPLRELHAAISAKIATLDPQAAGELRSRQATQLFYETLYEIDPRKRPYTVVPALAEALPKNESGHTRFTIRLRRGVHFHDDPCFKASGGKGREVTSADVIAMFERVATRALHSPYYSTFAGVIQGYEEFHEGRTAKISGLRARGPYELELKLLHPHPRLALELFDSRTSIVPSECVGFYGDAFMTHPVGTGAFVAGDVNLGSRVVGLRNPHYWRKGLPLVDRVVFEMFPEPQPAWLKFLAGQLDWITVGPENVGELKGLQAKGLKLEKELRQEARVIVFNMKDPVWGAKKDLRHAFALALDVDAILKRIYEGQAVRLQSIFAPNVYGFDPRFKSHWARRDLEGARKLLAKAGYPGGKGLPTLELLTTHEPESRHFAELVARQVAEVGITVELADVTWAELVNRANQMRFGLVAFGFSSESSDADDPLSRVMSNSDSFTDNSSAYRNPEIDRLGQQIGELPDGPERLQLIRRVQKILDDDLPYIPIVTRYEYQLTQPWVTNQVFTAAAYLGMFMKYKGTDRLH